MKAFVGVIITLVAVAVIAGFFVAGSPASTREKRFDERRVQDLESIQGQVISYWQNKNKLPQSLEELKSADVVGYSAPRDPKTGEGYGYEVRGPEVFALCATFSTDSEERKGDVRASYPYPMPVRGTEDGWSHGIGRKCFERKIDKDFYKPYPIPAGKD